MWKTAWDITSANSGAKRPKKENTNVTPCLRSQLWFPARGCAVDMTDLYAFTKPGDTAKSIIVLNVHPSFRLDSPEPTTKEPFAPGALYEFKIDTDGDAIADIAYSVQFSSSEDGKQTATLRRIQG